MRVNKREIFSAYVIAVIIYTRGNALTYHDVILMGKVLYVNEMEAVELTCQSSKTPINQYVEFFVDSRTVDFVQLARGKCFNSNGQCSEKICMCSLTGNEFIWIFYPKGYPRSHVFGCQVRHYDERHQAVVTTVSLRFDGSDFYKDALEQKVIAFNQDAFTTSNPKDTKSGVISYVAGVTFVVGSVLTLLIAIAIVVYNKRKRRREYAQSQKETEQRIREANAQDNAMHMNLSEYAQNENQDKKVDNLETSNNGGSDESSNNKLVENTNKFIDLESKIEEHHDNTSNTSEVG